MRKVCLLRVALSVDRGIQAVSFLTATAGDALKADMQLVQTEGMQADSCLMKTFMLRNDFFCLTLAIITPFYDLVLG